MKGYSKSNRVLTAKMYDSKMMITVYGTNLRMALALKKVPSAQLNKKMNRSPFTPITRYADTDPYLTTLLKTADAIGVRPDQLIRVPPDAGADPLAVKENLPIPMLKIGLQNAEKALMDGNYPEALQAILPVMNRNEKMLAAHQLMADAGLNTSEILANLNKYFKEIKYEKKHIE